MKLFLTKYLKLTHAFYFTIGITIMPLCAQWFWQSLGRKLFIVCIIITFVSTAILSAIIHLIIHNLFWKLILTAFSGILVVAILFPVFEFSPFILAILGIVFLSGTMQLFDSVKETFPQINDSQIKRWLEIVLTLFTIFVSSMMVGFTIGWNNLYGDALKGTIERHIVITGINSNLIITMYYWFGAALIFLSGIKHLWFVRGQECQNGS